MDGCCKKNETFYGKHTVDNDGRMVEQHGRDAGWVFLEGAIIAGHEH
jgi:hypothetical protein